MSKEIITVGKVGGEDWVGTNNGGVGQLLFKLQDSKEIKYGLKKSHEHAKELGCRLYATEKENAALREALRLKEAECESIALDRQCLMIDLSLCIEELKAWASEYDDSDSNLLIEKVEESLIELGGGDEQQAD